MPIDWKTVVSGKVRDIVRAAQNGGGQQDIVCALLDINDARAGRVSPGVQQLIADTKLAGAIPISDGQGNRLVCIPVGLNTLIAALTKYEQTAELERQIKAHPDAAYFFRKPLASRSFVVGFSRYGSDVQNGQKKAASGGECCQRT